MIGEVGLGQLNIIPQGAKIQFPPESRSLFQAAMKFIELFLAFVERTVSLMDHTLSGDMARAGKGTDTLGGMQLLVQEGNIKHQYTGGILRDQFEALYKDVLRIYAINIPLDAKTRIFENNEWVFKPVDQHALQCNYDIRIEISDATANQGIARQEAVQKLQTLAGSPVVNGMTLVEDFLKAFGHKDVSKYILPEFQELIQAAMANPQIIEVVRQCMAQFAQQQQMQEAQGQAEKNIMRQNIQRDVEVQSGQEDRKIVDQVAESTKRELFRPAVQQATVQQMMGGI